MGSLARAVLKGLFFYLGVIILSTLFLLTLVEGLLIHFAGNTIQAAFLYLVAISSLASALWLFQRGKKILVAASYH